MYHSYLDKMDPFKAMSFNGMAQYYITGSILYTQLVIYTRETECGTIPPHPNANFIVQKMEDTAKPFCKALSP